MKYLTVAITLTIIAFYPTNYYFHEDFDGGSYGGTSDWEPKLGKEEPWHEIELDYDISTGNFKSEVTSIGTTTYAYAGVSSTPDWYFQYECSGGIRIPFLGKLFEDCDFVKYPINKPL